MHLWPSVMLRDSFKSEYLRKVEWNLARMKNEKLNRAKSSSNEQQQPLIEGDRDDPNSPSSSGFLKVCSDFVTVITCSYCCFCFGVCIDEEDML